MSTAERIKDLTVLIRYVHAVASDLPADVEEVVTRAEEIITLMRLKL